MAIQLNTGAGQLWILQSGRNQFNRTRQYPVQTCVLIFKKVGDTLKTVQFLDSFGKGIWGRREGYKLAEVPANCFLFTSLCRIFGICTFHVCVPAPPLSFGHLAAAPCRCNNYYSVITARFVQFTWYHWAYWSTCEPMRPVLFKVQT